MTKDQLIDRMIADIMEDFDFEKVHNIMMSLDWKWDIGNGEMTVPSIYRMTRQAERLYDDTLTLSFELEEGTAFAEDYNENSK